jgi:hypothetical protein
VGWPLGWNSWPFCVTAVTTEAYISGCAGEAVYYELPGMRPTCVAGVYGPGLSPFFIAELTNVSPFQVAGQGRPLAPERLLPGFPPKP